METPNVLVKRKRPWWLGIVIPFSCITIFLVAFLCNMYSSLNSLEFRSSVFGGYDFKRIEGSVSRAQISDYNYAEIMNISKNKGLIFPPNIQEGNISLFSFYEIITTGTNYFDRFEIYLEWEMSNILFNQEEERISSIENTAYSTTRCSIYSENLFYCPSYVTAYNYSSLFEYAILDKENSTIKYISFAEVGSIDNLVFSSECVPTKPIIKSDLTKICGRTEFYSIYR